MQEEEGGEILGPLEDCQGEAEGRHAGQVGAQAGPGGGGACQHWFSGTDCSGERGEDQEGNGRDMSLKLLCNLKLNVTGTKISLKQKGH